jgi:hypothetical protein
MSKANKWAGSFGKVASGGQGTTGGNTYKPVEKVAAPKSSSSIKDNVINMKQAPGDNMGMGHVSSHNDINVFTRGIKSRGPYGGPSFSSLNNSEKDYQSKDTKGISNFKTPSGSGKGK